MRLADLDYPLEPERIAQEPIEPRDSARLLVDRGSAPPEHRIVRDIPDLLRPGEVVRFHLYADRGAALAAVVSP